MGLLWRGYRLLACRLRDIRSLTASVGQAANRCQFYGQSVSVLFSKIQWAGIDQDDEAHGNCAREEATRRARQSVSETIREWPRFSAQVPDMKAVTSPLDSHGPGMRNSCVSNTFRPNHRRFPDSLSVLNGTRNFATLLVQGCCAAHDRIGSAPLVLSRSVNLGVLKMPPRSGKRKRSASIDESPYLIEFWENPSAILY
jgi:hypothetical protein